MEQQMDLLSSLPTELILAISEFLAPYQLVPLTHAHPCFTAILASEVYNRAHKETNGQVLLWAATYGSVITARRAIAEGERVDDPGNEQCLLLAIRGNHPDMCDLLLKQPGVRVTSVDRLSNTALIWAIRRENDEVALRLIECSEFRGLLSAQNRELETPLWWAASRGRGAVVQQLLKREPEYHLRKFINDRNKQGTPPLSIAARNGHEEVVRMLLEHNSVQVNAKNDKGQTAFFHAAVQGHEVIMQLLIERDGLGPEAVEESSKTKPRWGRRPTFKFLMEQTDINERSRDSSGATPLHYASSWGNERTVKLLVEKYNVNSFPKDRFGRTPLYYAATNGRIEIVKLLINRYSPKEHIQEDFRTVASGAAKNGHTKVLNYFVSELTEDGPKEDSIAQEVFWTAAEFGHQGLVEELLQREDVHVDAKAYDGRTAFSRAVCTNKMDLVNFLFSQPGINPDARDNGGYTPLYWAVRSHALKAVEFLLSAGVSDPYERLTDYGESAWRQANRWKQNHIIQLMQTICPRDEEKTA